MELFLRDRKLCHEGVKVAARVKKMLTCICVMKTRLNSLSPDDMETLEQLYMIFNALHKR